MTSVLAEGMALEVADAPKQWRRSEECQHEMFVETRWEKRTLAVPLSQVKPIAARDRDTREAVEDWHYWLDQGYML